MANFLSIREWWDYEVLVTRHAWSKMGKASAIKSTGGGVLGFIFQHFADISETWKTIFIILGCAGTVFLIDFVFKLLWSRVEIHKEQQAANKNAEARIKELTDEFKNYKEQRKPLELYHLVLKSQFDDFRCPCVMVVKNPNPTQTANNVELRLLKIEPALKHKFVSLTSDNLFLSSIRFSPKDKQSTSLKGNQSAHFDLFATSRMPLEITFQFCGELRCEAPWDRIPHEFIPEALSKDEIEPGFQKYILTLEATADGLERKESCFRLSFSLDPQVPAFILSPL